MNGPCDPNDSGYYSENAHAGPRSQSSTPVGIGGLGRRAKKLVSTINKLQAAGVESSGLPLPKIVVLGDQSSGKSSLIEAISEIKVPRSSGTCTRCVMQINLMPANACSWKISLVRKYSWLPRGGIHRSGDFQDWMLNDELEDITSVRVEQEEVESYLQRAQNAILCPRLDQAAIFHGKIEPANPVGFSPNIIKLDITGPNLETLTLYDLPGIINQSDEASDDLPELVQGLAHEYASNDNTIIVLACPVSQDYVTSTAASLVRKWRATHRSIGVLTKPDTLPPGDKPDQWLKILDGKQFELGHGYFVTKQPDSIQLRDGITHDQARESEIEFFSRKPWIDVFSKFRARFGTPALHAKLSQLLANEIASKLPEIQAQVAERLQEITAELGHYQAPPPNPYATVLDAISRLTSDVSQYIQGEYPYHRLVIEWRDINRRFWESLKDAQPLVIVNTGAEAHWDLSGNSSSNSSSNFMVIDDSDHEEDLLISSGSKRAASTLSSQESPSKRMKMVRPTPPSTRSSNASGTRTKFTLNYVRDTVTTMTTSGVPNDTDPRAEDHLISESISKWDELVERYLHSIHEAVKKMLDDLLQVYSNTWKSTRLPEALHQAVYHCFRSIYSAHRENVLQSLAAEQLKPYTLNGEILKFHRNNAREHLKGHRQLARAKAYVIAQAKAGNNLVPDDTELKNKANAIKEAAKDPKRDKLGQDPYNAEIEVVSRIRGYYRLSADTFADSLAKKGQFELLHALQLNLKDALHEQLGIAGEDAECMSNCRMLLTEDPERERKREELAGEKMRLQKAMELLNGIQA